jgi:hypothetical protein
MIAVMKAIVAGNSRVTNANPARLVISASPVNSANPETIASNRTSAIAVAAAIGRAGIGPLMKGPSSRR